MRRGALAVALVVVPAEARADAPSTSARCVALADEGQYVRDHGKLLEARRAFSGCAEEGCPTVVRQACHDWLEDVDRRLPTVKVTVVDARGGPRAAEVRLDGQPLAAGDASGPFPVEPGFHVFSATSPGLAPTRAEIRLEPGQKDVVVKLVLEQPKGPEERRDPNRVLPEPTEKSVPLATWILGGVAVASGTASIVFWQDAVSRGDDLRAGCAPGCTDEEIAPVGRSLTVSHVALGVAAGSAVAALAWYVFTPPKARRSAQPGAAVFRF